MKLGWRSVLEFTFFFEVRGCGSDGSDPSGTDWLAYVWELRQDKMVAIE